MAKNKLAILFVLCAFASQIWGCSMASTSSNSGLLLMKDVASIDLTAPHGSGAIRALMLHYKSDGTEKEDTLGNIRRIDSKSYNDEEKEQQITLSDIDPNDPMYIIVYQEFWFPDIAISHAEIPEWPTIYEYNFKDGFTVASSKHKDYFKSYIKSSKELLTTYSEHMSGGAILAQQRLITAAEQIVKGRFIPQSLYDDHHYYRDVYELTKAP